MPTYATLDDLPESKALQTWIAFKDRLINTAELTWLNGKCIRHDLTGLRQSDSPLLVIVKVADDWERMSLGRSPTYKVNYDIWLRLYFYISDDMTIDETEALYDNLEKANEVIVSVLRSAYMACYEPYWKELFIAGGEKTGRTSVIGRQNERLFITTRIRLLRAFRPGQ